MKIDLTPREREALLFVTEAACQDPAIPLSDLRPLDAGAKAALVRVLRKLQDSE